MSLWRSLLLMAKRFGGRALCAAPVGRTIAMLTGGRHRFAGRVIDAPPALVAPGEQAALFWNIYESGERRFIQKHLRRDTDVVELGASIGAMSSLIRTRMGEDRTLVSVEADSALADVAEHNLTVNADGRSFTVVRAALDYGTDAAETTFWRGGSSTTGGIRAGAGSESFPVARTTIASLIRDARLGDFTLVSDIEGAEAGFILDHTGDLARCRQMIIELHDTHYGGAPVTVSDMVEALVWAGFVVSASHGPVFVLDRPDALVRPR